ncbi:oxidoreductase [Nonomuraea rhodomycinica]|uniref:oxidoreductase n=1 Tax=Nonomuraea rhodomycinica TaxID=1712872 RepID=UPI0028A9722D|nr:oxidoreductase [Nonomuraea rhodomycinica]
MSDPLAVVARLPGVPEAVEEARRAVDLLYRHRVLRRASPTVSAESSLRGARASAAIEGVDVPLDALRRDEVHDPVVQGALRASAELGRLGPTWRKAPRQVLARLHTVAAAGLTDAASLGRPRTDGPDLRTDATGFSRMDATGFSRTDTTERASEPGRAPAVTDVPAPVTDVPGSVTDAAAPVTDAPAPVGDPLGLGPAPGAKEAGVRMEGLFELLATPTKAPAIVLAAVVHAELAVLRPFGTADGVVARAAERLTLVEYGLDPKSLAVVEAGHLELPYAEGLRAYLTGTGDGVAQWVRQCASAVTLGVREATAVCEALQRG